MSGASQGLRVASAGAGEAYADIDVADDEILKSFMGGVALKF